MKRTKITIETDEGKKCPICKGTGKDPNVYPKWKDCDNCHGTGWV